MSDADTRGSASRQEAAGLPGPAESSGYTLPSYSDTADERQECRSLSHLGILMPLYLLPLLFLGTKYGGCVYCLLLPLLLWAFNSLPKPGAALVHMITVPLMGLMKPEQIAHQYLSVEALALAMMLCLVVVVDHWSDLSLHLALNVSQRFGLRRGRLFTLLCLCCFVCASLFSGVVTSAGLLYMLHRVLYAVFNEDMDRAQGVVVPPEGGFRGSSVQGSLQETSSMRSVAATGDQVLFERLTQVVLSMQKPDGTSHTPTPAPQMWQASIAAAPREPKKAEERSLSATRRFSQWYQMWSRKQSMNTPKTPVPAPKVRVGLDPLRKSPTSAAQRAVVGRGGTGHTHAAAARVDALSMEPGTQASTSGAPMPLQTLVRVDVTDEGGAFNPMTPFAVNKKKDSVDYQRKPEMRHLGVTAGLRRTDQSRMSQSMTDVTLEKREEPGRQSRGLSLLFRRASSMCGRKNKASEISTPNTPGEKQSRFMGSIGAIAGFFTRKRFSESQPKRSDEEVAHSHDQPASVLQTGTKRDASENEPKPNADKVVTNVPSIVREATTAPPSRPLLVTASEQHLGTAKTAMVQPRRTLSAIVPTATITETARATEAGGPLIAPTKLGDPNLPADIPAALAAMVRGTHAPSESLECSSVLPTKRTGQASIPRSCPPMTENEVQNGGTFTTKVDAEANGGRKGDNTADDQGGGKPVREETRKGSYETNEHADAAADAIATKEKLNIEIKASRGTKQEGKKAHSKSRSDKDTSAASKKRKRSGKKSRDSTSGSHRQSPRSKSRTSICENTQDAHDAPQKDQMQSKPLDPVSLTQEGDQPIQMSPNGIHGEMKDKSDSGSQSVSAPTTEIEQVGVVTASKIYCGRSTEGLEHVLQPVQSDSTKASPPSANESGSDSVAQKAIPKMGSSDPQDSSHMSKSLVKSRQITYSPVAKNRVKKTKQPTMAVNARPSSRETSIQKSEALKEQSPSRLNAAETQIQPKSCATPKAPETTAVCETEKALEPTKSNEPDKTASSASTSRSKDSKSTTGKTPTFQEVQHVPNQSNASLRDAGGVSRTGLQTPRRKQSIVSFGAGIKEAPKALAHLEEMAPQPLPRKNLATILKASRSTTVPRVEPSVDFGDTHFTMISPAHSRAGEFPQRPLSTSSRLSRMSTGSVSSLVDSEFHSSGRPAITLRRVTRCRSSGLEDTILRGAHVQPSVFGSRPAGSFASLRRKKQLSSDRADVHNAFLLGPSLVTMLGNICSFHTGGNKSALKIVYGAFETALEQSLNGSTWVMVTLPGAILTFIICTTIIWLVYLRPYDPEPLSPENLSVMKAARERSAARGKQREAQCAYATYLVILGLSYTPALIWDLEPRMVMVVALASVMLVTNVLTSCLRVAFDFQRHVWEMLPWGVILMLGATQVASKLLQAHGLAIESFRLIPSSFWEERSALELQVMIAFAASTMAEATDKQVLVEIMTPMVVHIADMKRMYPAYYSIPLIVGASSNCIMPASVPFAILHGLAKVTFLKLLLLGLFAKVVIISTVIATVNLVDRFGYLGSHVHAD